MAPSTIPAPIGLFMALSASSILGCGNHLLTHVLHIPHSIMHIVPQGRPTGSGTLAAKRSCLTILLSEVVVVVLIYTAMQAQTFTRKTCTCTDAREQV